MMKIENKNPVFSIILTTYNRPKMLNRSIKSVLTQTFKNFELIIVDDASTQDNADIISRYNTIPMRVIVNTSNMGPAESRNIGIAAARGSYISFLDDDDEYLNSFLMNTYNHLNNTSKNIGFSWCGIRYGDDDKKSETNAGLLTREFLSKYPTRQEFFEEIFSIGTGFGVTFKRNCIKKVGFFNSKLKVTEDTDFFLRTLLSGYLPTIIPGIHIIVHNHSQSRLSSCSTHERRLFECEWILNKYKKFFRKYPFLRKDMICFMERLKKELLNSTD